MEKLRMELSLIPMSEDTLAMVKYFLPVLAERTRSNQAFRKTIFDFLKKIRLSAGLTEIDEYTFFLCESLKSITIPEGVTHIGKGAFMGCSLSRIVLPESLRSIGEEAFDGCDFKKVRIPKNIVEIGKDAFPKGTQLIRYNETE